MTQACRCMKHSTLMMRIMEPSLGRILPRSQAKNWIRKFMHMQSEQFQLQGYFCRKQSDMDLCERWRNKTLICGNKMPTRCNRCFYCRSYCLLNMFRAPLCPSSGAQEYYTVVGACGISCFGFQVAGLVWSWGLCVTAACCSILQAGHITLSSTPDQQLENHSTKYHRQQPLYNTLELLMMVIVVPETCWASNKTCNKNICCI